MRHRSFPGWIGPVVGPFAGLALGFRAVREAGSDARVPILAGAGALGRVAGLIVWFLDARKGGENFPCDFLHCGAGMRRGFVSVLSSRGAGPCGRTAEHRKRQDVCLSCEKTQSSAAG